MSQHKRTVDKLASKYKDDEKDFALLVTGSVARNEQTDNSDLDLLIISNEKQPFEEKLIDGIVVEIKTNTVDGFIQKMKDEPMNVYQWLDAKLIFDKNNSAQKVINEANNIYNNYSPDPREIAGVKKWLDSAKIKIESARESNDELALGFNVSNILWQIVRALYLLNNKPIPPSTTAFKRIKDLKNLPDDFDKLWKESLTQNLKSRTEATLKILDFDLFHLQISPFYWPHIFLVFFK